MKILIKWTTCCECSILKQYTKLFFIITCLMVFQIEVFGQTCSTSTYFKAATRSENTARYNAWVTAAGESPDQTITFENYTNGQTLNNINLGRLGASILNLENSGSSGIVAHNDIGSAPPIGTRGARIDDNSNDGDDIRISFTTPVNYVGFYIIDLNGSSSTHQVRVNYSDGTLCNFTIDGVNENCQCEEFLGIVAPTGKLIQNIELYPNGGSQYGIDNLMYGTVSSPCTLPLGTAPSLTCPKVAQFNIHDGIGSCDIDENVPGDRFNCAASLSQLSRNTGNTTCECNDEASCVGDWAHSEADNWSQGSEVFFTINFDPTKTVNFGELLIQALTGPNIGGINENLNYPRRLAVRVYQNGTQIFTTNGITMSTTTWTYHSVNLSSLVNRPGNAT
ncbi:MAG: hypothetical protein IPL08_05685 [Saprospiraceae bacterium]|nr:hypothetical protein [Saprospiraceae bacterium]